IVIGAAGQARSEVMLTFADPDQSVSIPAGGSIDVTFAFAIFASEPSFVAGSGLLNPTNGDTPLQFVGDTDALLDEITDLLIVGGSGDFQMAVRVDESTAPGLYVGFLDVGGLPAGSAFAEFTVNVLGVIPEPSTF